MNRVFLSLAMTVVCLFGSASQAQSIDLDAVFARVLDVAAADGGRMSELVPAACSDLQGFVARRALIIQKIQTLHEEEKAIILQYEAAPADTPFTFRKNNLKGHANRKGYESVMLGQRLVFADQAIARCSR